MRQIKNYKQIFIVLFILLATIKCNAQSDSNWVLKFTKKGHSFIERPTDYKPNKNGFYLYENCIYALKLNDGSKHNAFVKKIKNDSIIFINDINFTAASEDYEEAPQTIAPSQIKYIKMTNHFLIDYFTSKRLKKYESNFTNSNLPKSFIIDTVIENEMKFAIIKKVGSFGVTNERVFIENLHEYKPYIAPKIDSSKYKVRNVVWLSPLRAKEINGLAIGIATGNSLGAEMPVKINGINANVDLLTVFASIMVVGYTFYKINIKDMNDTLSFEGTNSINGLSISAGGVLEGRKLNGIFLNGGICQTDIGNGIIISGLRTMTEDFKGISIAGLRNDATYFKGIQIGLINTCKHLKGIQIGLWNVNSKRKLPFINWGT